MELSRQLEEEGGAGFSTALSSFSFFQDLQEGLPYPFANQIKILGIIFDMKLCFEAHIETILDRAKIRVGVISRLAGCTWGAETGILRLTGDSLVVSLMRYGLPMIGSGAYEQSINKLEVCVVNILARKIAGVARSARLPVLHMAAGVVSYRNLYIQNCGQMVDHVLRAGNSSIKKRIGHCVCQAYQVEDWTIQAVQFKTNKTLTTRTYCRKFFDVNLQEFWTVNILSTSPEILSKLKVGSVFYSNAKEAESRPDLKEQSFNFHNVNSWVDVGLQVLHASGWRPDCTHEDVFNVEKSLPPRDPRHMVIFSGWENMRWHRNIKMPQGYKSWIEGAPGGLSVTVGSFFQGGVGASSAWVRRPDGFTFTQAWVLGEDPFSVEPPEFILECSVVHALVLVERQLKAEGTCPTYIGVKAGNGRVITTLKAWFNSGTAGLLTAAASDLIGCFSRLIPMLPCPIVIEEIPHNFFDKTSDRRGWLPGEEKDIVFHTAKRLFEEVLPEIKTRYQNRVARLPWNPEETKSHLKARYRKDELKFVGLLQQTGSIASGIALKLGVNRDIIKQILNTLRYFRRAQVTFCDILCATRFKMWDETGNLLDVECPKCKERDSFEHLLSCAGRDLGEPPTDPAKLITFCRQLTLKAMGGTPGLHTPVFPPTETEIELAWDVSTNDEISF